MDSTDTPSPYPAQPGGSEPAPDAVDGWSEEGLAGAVDAVEQAEAVLTRVEQALTRLGEGTFGTCAGCGGQIPDAALASDPTATACGACEPAEAVSEPG